MGIPRREFLKNGLAGIRFLALPGSFLFAVPPGYKPPRKANLVFGVVSDTHMMTDGSGVMMHKSYSDRHFISALKYFHDANVDAVVHLGDMANAGNVEEVKYHADAWRKVFPGDKGADGRRVERLFITGNHDLDWKLYENRRMVIWPDEAKRTKHTFAFDAAAHWRKIWGEDYADIWHREVKGYHFFAWQWGVDSAEAGQFILNRADECGIAGRKPFFCLSHTRPHYAFRKCIRLYANAVSLFGHVHLSATNWNTIYMYNEEVETFPSIQCPPCTAPDWPLPLNKDEFAAKVPLSGMDAVGKGRQGFVVRVYDDMMVIERREFSQGGSLGPDWVMPLGKYDPHPFSKNELKKVIGEPQFPAKAKLVVKTCMASVIDDTANADTNKKSKAKEVPAVRVSIPIANGNPDSRVYAYEVVVVGDEGTPKLHKAVYAAGCNMGIGHEPNGGVTTLEIPKSELPSGKTLTIAARPLSSLGTSGKAIMTTFKV